MFNVFSIAGVTLWNGLRIALRNCKNIFALKNAQNIYTWQMQKGYFILRRNIMFNVLAFGIFMH